MKKAASETYAAVDLGSNSFHMIVASYADKRIQTIDRIKNMIRMATGLDKNGNLTDESIERAIQCLEEFGQRIREIPQVNIRAVGTNTLRQAKNSRKFLTRARKALGHPIEIISGREEARLIYLGVAHSIYDDADKRLVVDIGGGSTELITGKGFDIYNMESFYIGCVNMSKRYFDKGTITTKNMQNAVLAVRQELESITATYKACGWNKVIGASGTIHTINNIIRTRGWENNGISAVALAKLRTEVTTAGNIDQLKYENLSPNRRPVFAGGLAILCGIFEAFDIEMLVVSDGALREGLLYDLIGRYHDEDIRDRTITEFSQRYTVDQEQAARVRRTAVELFRQAKDNWLLDEHADLKFLGWAAQVHEAGLAIAHAQYHRHGAYLLANSDLAGFSRQDQSRLALLVRIHRRKIPLEEINLAPEDEREMTVRLGILLRLAIVLNRSRFYTSLPSILVEASGHTITIGLPKKWLEKNPLTRTDLDSEADYLRAIGYVLKYSLT